MAKHQTLTAIIFIFWATFDFWNKSSRFCNSYSAIREYRIFWKFPNGRAGNCIEESCDSARDVPRTQCAFHSTTSFTLMLLFFLSLFIVSTGYFC